MYILFANADPGCGVSAGAAIISSSGVFHDYVAVRKVFKEL